MQGSHKEGEFWQLEIWTRKSYVRLPFLHNSKWAETSRRFFMEYIRIIGANNYQRGPTRWAQPTWERRGPQARPGGCALLGPPPVPLFWYISHFGLEKNKGETFGTERRRLEAELGQEHFFSPTERFCRGNFPLGGGKSSSSSSPTTLPSWGGKSPSTSSLAPSHLKP